MVTVKEIALGWILCRLVYTYTYVHVVYMYECMLISLFFTWYNIYTEFHTARCGISMIRMNVITTSQLVYLIISIVMNNHIPDTVKTALFFPYTSRYCYDCISLKNKIYKQGYRFAYKFLSSWKQTPTQFYPLKDQMYVFGN